MKKTMVQRTICLFAFCFLVHCKGPGGYLPGYEPMQGDIVFQSLPKSGLVIAIEGVSQSPYSHCGVVMKEGADWYVLEAIGPVMKTKLDDYVGRGRGKKADVFRLRKGYRDSIPQFLAAAQKYMGLPYDIKYEMDDEKIYCSELLFKAFKTVYAEDLGETAKLGDLNWGPHEQFIMRVERGPVPFDREMITPRGVSEAQQLEAVHKGIKHKNP